MGAPQVSFFAYYRGPPQISFFAYYMGPPSGQFLRLLYGGLLRPVSSLTMCGPPRSVSSHTIWGPPSGQFLCLLYMEQPQIGFVHYMGAPSDQFLRILFGGPLISISLLTIWGPPRISFFASHNKKYHSGIRGIYITNTSTTMVFTNEKTRSTTITVPRLLLPFP